MVSYLTQVIKKTIPALLLPCLVIPVFGQAAKNTKKTSSYLRFMSPELRKLRDEMGILQAKDKIRQLKHKLTQAKEENRLYELTLQSKLASEELKTELASLNKKVKKLELENKLIQATSSKEILLLSLKNKKLGLELEVEKKQAAKEIFELKKETQLVTLQNLAMKQLIESKKLKYQKKISEIDARLALAEKRKLQKRQVVNDLVYLHQPFRNRVLHISDRRIRLNGPIITGTADYITGQIHYFNNKSRTKPIFLVIDVSPGGSVMEGYRILKAIETSPAPVHVVVKSFAASMAAVIVTSAKNSYAYKNAIILHHQPSWRMSGNVAQHKQQLDMLKEWARRLHKPVAEKMKISLDQFYQQMYKHHVDGDWQEFADNALKLGWVNNIASEIREEGYSEYTKEDKPRSLLRRIRLEEKEKLVAEQTLLPRPRPFDFYFLYDPQKEFTWQ